MVLWDMPRMPRMTGLSSRQRHRIYHAPLIDQLADKGRLVAPVGSRDLQQLVRIRKQGDRISRETFGGVVFVPLLGCHGWQE